MQQMPDMAALLKIAQSPAGQKLLSMIKSSNSVDLDSITSAAASGNLEEAKQQLHPIFASDEVKALLKQLEKQL
jgi:hypothetical protein